MNTAVTTGESPPVIFKIDEHLVPNAVLSVYLVRGEQRGVETGALKEIPRWDPTQLEVRSEVLILAGVMQKYAPGLKQFDEISDLGTAEHSSIPLMGYSSIGCKHSTAVGFPRSTRPACNTGISRCYPWVALDLLRQPYPHAAGDGWLLVLLRFDPRAGVLAKFRSPPYLLVSEDRELV